MDFWRPVCDNHHSIRFYHMFNMVDTTLLNVDLNPIELVTNICDMFKRIEVDTKATVCLEHMFGAIKN